MNISTRRLSLAATVAVVVLAVLMVVSPAAAAKPAAAVKPVEITKPAAAGERAAAAKPVVPNNAPRAALAGKDAVSTKKGVASAKKQLLPADTPSPRTGDFEIDGKGKLVRYKGSARDVVIPDSVKVIGKEAFYRTGVVKVKVPATVTEIEERGFAYCRELAAVEFEDAEAKPSKLVKVGESAFSGTGALKEIVLPRSVTHLGKVAFYDSGIEKVALPAGLTEIPERAFMKAGHLMDVTVSDNVTKIDFRAFAITHSLRSLKVVGANGQISTGFPSKLKVLGKWAFWRSGIRQAVLPSGLEAIEESAFNRSALEKLTLQEGLKSIGHGAFSFTNLTELTIPDSVVHADGAVSGTRKIAKLHIGKGVGPDQFDGSFARNDSLRTISVSEGNPNYVVVGRALFNKQLTKLIVVPRGLAGSSRLKTYNVPASVTTIASYAFSNSAYEEVNLPSGLRTVEN
ncbi:MAG: leucine-rich repeat domain-containing protein, partial [Peptidiphaga gingivicola]